MSELVILRMRGLASGGMSVCVYVCVLVPGKRCAYGRLCAGTVLGLAAVGAGSCRTVWVMGFSLALAGSGQGCGCGLMLVP